MCVVQRLAYRKDGKTRYLMIGVTFADSEVVACG